VSDALQEIMNLLADIQMSMLTNAIERRNSRIADIKTVVEASEVSEKGFARIPMEALVGFQGRGCADGVQPNCCHPFLLEALLFQRPSIRRCASRTMVEHKTPKSNKSAYGNAG